MCTLYAVESDISINAIYSSFNYHLTDWKLHSFGYKKNHYIYLIYHRELRQNCSILWENITHATTTCTSIIEIGGGKIYNGYILCYMWPRW